MKRFGRAARLVAVVALLLGTVYTGIADGVGNVRSATEPLERVGVASQLTYGVFGAATLFASAIARRWMIPILLVWGVALTITGGLAPVVWGEQGALVGIVGGLSTAGVVALAVWACRSHNREVAERRAREEAG